jgi:hypothetical protein
MPILSHGSVSICRTSRPLRVWCSAQLSNFDFIEQFVIPVPGHGHGLFTLAIYYEGKWTTNRNPLSPSIPLGQRMAEALPRHNLRVFRGHKFSDSHSQVQPRGFASTSPQSRSDCVSHKSTVGHGDPNHTVTVTGYLLGDQLPLV